MRPKLAFAPMSCDHTFVMAKKTKTSTKNLTTKTTTAPMIVRAPAPEAAVAAPPVVATPAPVVAAPAVQSAPVVAIDRDLIARLAFSKFMARGCVHGFAVEDWLAAEAELRAAASASAAKA